MQKIRREVTLGTVEFPPQTITSLKKIVASQRVTYGPFSREFESQFAKIHESGFSIFVNSGTSALQVALHALKKKYGWEDGDEILVPALTFVASINIIIQNGLKPVFVDIESDYYGMDPAKIEEKITPRTVGLEIVHLFGQPADMTEIMRIAKKHNLKIFEDSCETMFAKYKGKYVGSFGEVACFSTYAAHLLVTGVGGLCMTKDKSLAVLMRSLANHGRDGIYISIDDDNELTKSQLSMVMNKRFEFEDVGYSYRATEMEAALGLAQLKGWKKMIAKRQSNAKYLTEKLSPLSHQLSLPKIRPETDHVFMVYPIVITDKNYERDDVILTLEKNGIETRKLLPTLSQPVYKRLFGNIENAYPIAKRVSDNGFYVGCHQDLSHKDLDWLVEVLTKALKSS